MYSAIQHKYIDSVDGAAHQSAIEIINDMSLLIEHAWIHSGFENCGYQQMTTKQKKMFDMIVRLEK